ncbi:flagellar biosynthesis protein FlhB [Thioalkalivibrio sp.]|uniref:flagellar biosynthesis protein FlhB n=1 Tax=Thioalkalivibrio sp. TaxID=2093813 RepID=UPI003976A2A5
MAENDTSQEKSEEPTPKRLREAKEKGQVASSRELNTTLVLLGGGAALLLMGGGILGGLQDILRGSFSVERELIFDPGVLYEMLLLRIGEALVMLLPLFGVLLVVAVAGPLSMGGGGFSGKAIAPKLNKLNPIAGLKRIFSAQGLMEFGKTLLKFILITSVGGALLWQMSDTLLGLGHQPLERGLMHAGYIIGWTFLTLAAVLILVALIDVPFQLWSHQKQLRMTKQQVRDEFKETEGKPEVKSKIRQTQQDIARRRMMAEVPKADVVVTNPTHYAVALRYDQTGMRAPRVVAKGADLIAAEIRERARAAGVSLFAAPPLARALYYSTRLDQEIPAGLYVAVAQVLAYVYQLRTAARDGAARRPEAPTDLPVPDDLLRRTPPRED